MGNLSKNFSKDEFACPCCGLATISLGIVTIAEMIREFEGGDPITPNSGCRCRNYNEKVQKEANKDYIRFSSKSTHMPLEGGTCTAGDFPSKNPERLYNFLDSLFPNTYGIGVYSWGIHIDTRKVKVRW